MKLSYNKWAIEDDRADDVTVIVAYVNSTNDVDMLTHGADVYDEGDERATTTTTMMIIFPPLPLWMTNTTTTDK